MVYGLVLHAVERVDDKAVGEEVLAPKIHHQRVRRVGAVLDRLEEMGAA